MLLILAASNGANLTLARRFADLCAAEGIEHELLDVVALGWPLYTRDEHDRGVPEGFANEAARFHRAEGFVVCAPEYNGSIPPALTSLIAWLSVADEDFRAIFNGKRAILASHSGGAGHKGLVAMRLQLSHLGCDVQGREYLCNPAKELNDEGARAALVRLAAPAG